MTSLYERLFFNNMQEKNSYRNYIRVSYVSYISCTQYSPCKITSLIASSWVTAWTLLQYNYHTDMFICLLIQRSAIVWLRQGLCSPDFSMLNNQFWKVCTEIIYEKVFAFPVEFRHLIGMLHLKKVCFWNTQF